MANETMRSIRNSMRSIESARKLARAMFLSASAKYRRAQRQAEESRAFKRMAEEMSALLIPYRRAGEETQISCRIVIAGDRGMSGGYNGRIIKSIRGDTDGYRYLPIGRKAAEALKRENMRLTGEDIVSAEKAGFSEIRRHMASIAEMWLRGEIRGAEIVYTALSGEIRREKLLSNRKYSPNNETTIFESEPMETLCNVLADLLAGVVYANICEANAAEQRFRRMAMDIAQKNAEEMLEKMQRKLNRIRQANVTQEMIEAVSAGLRENGGD